MERVPGLVGVLQPFSSPTPSNGLVVDVLAGHGHLWVKVIARKAQALHLIWAGQGQFGERDLLHQANEYLACAKANLHHFTTPMVYFAFYNHVTRPMAEALRSLGIHVLGTVVDVDENVQEKLTSLCFDDDDDDSVDEDDDDDDDDVSVNDHGLPEVGTKDEENPTPGRLPMEKSDTLAVDGKPMADESFSEHFAYQSLPYDTPIICSGQSISSERLPIEGTHATHRCPLDSKGMKDFTTTTSEKKHSSYSTAIFSNTENSTKTANQIDGKDSYAKLPQTSKHISETNLIKEHMRLSSKSSTLSSLNTFEQTSSPSIAFHPLCHVDNLPRWSNYRTNGPTNVVEEQSKPHDEPCEKDVKLTPEQKFCKEGSGYHSPEDEAVFRTEAMQTNIPTQKPSDESHDSLTEFYVASSSLHSKPYYANDPSSSSSSSSFNALFKLIVLSPPAFRSNGALLLESISSRFGECDATHDAAISRDETICIAPSAPIPVTKANLDISTLITLVSSVSHGNSHFRFDNKVLSLQAEEERKSPVLPVLKQFLEGKQLLACHTAVASFQAILDTLGGPREKARAADLLTSVHVIADEPSPRTMALERQGKIKERSKIVFGTGDQLRAVTVTSNMGFVRAARNQGVVFSVFFHQARALTEQKENCAEEVDP